MNLQGLIFRNQLFDTREIIPDCNPVHHFTRIQKLENDGETRRAIDHIIAGEPAGCEFTLIDPDCLINPLQINKDLYTRMNIYNYGRRISDHCPVSLVFKFTSLTGSIHA